MFFFFTHFSYLLQIVPALARADYQARMMFRGDFLTLCQYFLPFHATTQPHLVRFVLKTRSIIVVVTKRKKNLVGKKLGKKLIKKMLGLNLEPTISEFPRCKHYNTREKT